MADKPSPTARLRALKQSYNSNPDTWGNLLNDGALELLDEAFGLQAVTVNANVVLTVNNFISDQARKMILRLTGPGGFSVEVPAVDKAYLVVNACAADVTLKPAGGTGAIIRAGISVWAFSDGTVVSAVDTTLDKIKAAAAPVNLNGQRLTNIAPGTADTDAATRKQIMDLTADQVLLAQNWATKLTTTVDGSEYSAKEYAVGTSVGAGSAKSWSTSLTVVADGLKGARGYASDAAASATASAGSATASGTSATNSANSATASGTSATNAANTLTDFNNRYVVASGFPTTGNFDGRLAFSTTAAQVAVYSASLGAYQIITSPQQATTTAAGIVELATAAETTAGTDTLRAVTPASLLRNQPNGYAGLDSTGSLSGLLNTRVTSEVFTASGTFTKEADDVAYWVECIGAGGSGSCYALAAGGGGGGGGEYNCGLFGATLLSASTSVTVGAGGGARATGLAGADGGTTSFGSFLLGRGGKGGLSGVGGASGSGAVGARNVSPPAAAAGGFNGSGGGVTSDASCRSGASTTKGGGGGGGSSSQPGAGGTSLDHGSGGAGGDIGVAGSVPGGGGGGGNTTSGAGARGEVRIWRFKK